MNLLNTLKLSALTIICTTGMHTYACQFHGASGAPWARFGHGPNSGQPSRNYSDDARTQASKLNLKVPVVLRAEQNKPTKLPVSYRYNADGDNSAIQLSLDIEIDPAAFVDVDSKNTVLSGDSGQHSFTLTPQNRGVYRLLVVIRTINQAEPSEKREVIYLKVI